MVKSTKTGNPKTKHSMKAAGTSGLRDAFVWIVIILVFVGAMAVNYFYLPSISSYLRAAGWIVLALVFLGLALLTRKGKVVLGFSKDARNELRKVHWPSRQETVQTTLMVIVMVIIIGIFLWAIDALFMSIVNWLTSQRG